MTFIQEIRAKLQEIGRNPLLYQLRPEIGAEAGIGSYAILFWVTGDTVRIERIVYGGWDLAEIFGA